MRPRPGVTRDTDLRIPVTDEEREAIRLAATEGRMAMATWAREVLLRAARRVALGLDADADGLPPVVARVRDVDEMLDAALAEEPRRSDAAIGEALNLSVDIVRRHRQARGIAAVHPSAYASTDWAARISEAHSRGLTSAEIAAETGYTVRTVQQRLSQLRLRAHRAPRR